MNILTAPETLEMEAATTPDEWLLAVFDSYGSDFATNNIRQMFQELEDHFAETCPDDLCPYWSGQASWPTPINSGGLIRQTSNYTQEFIDLIAADDALDGVSSSVVAF